MQGADAQSRELSGRASWRRKALFACRAAPADDPLARTAVCDLEHAKDEVECGRDGGFTVRCRSGPKTGLEIHFFAEPETLVAWVRPAAPAHTAFRCTGCCPTLEVWGKRLLESGKAVEKIALERGIDEVGELVEGRLDRPGRNRSEQRTDDSRVFEQAV